MKARNLAVVGAVLSEPLVNNLVVAPPPVVDDRDQVLVQVLPGAGEGLGDVLTCITSDSHSFARSLFPRSLALSFPLPPSLFRSRSRSLSRSLAISLVKRPRDSVNRRPPLLCGARYYTNRLHPSIMLQYYKIFGQKCDLS
jgi:hypothetical protein